MKRARRGAGEALSTLEDPQLVGVACGRAGAAPAVDDGAVLCVSVRYGIMISMSLNRRVRPACVPLVQVHVSWRRI